MLRHSSGHDYLLKEISHAGWKRKTDKRSIRAVPLLCLPVSSCRSPEAPSQKHRTLQFENCCYTEVSGLRSLERWTWLKCARALNAGNKEGGLIRGLTQHREKSNLFFFFFKTSIFCLQVGTIISLRKSKSQTCPVEVYHYTRLKSSRMNNRESNSCTKLMQLPLTQWIPSTSPLWLYN